MVHRDYSLQGEAIRIFYYTDRVEIRNPGLLMPGVRLEELQQGQARSKPRNPILTTILREFPGGYMEPVGSGISFMINQMRELGRPDPQFREQGEFIVTFSRAEPATQSETAPSQVRTSPLPPSSKKRPRISGETDLGRKKRQRLALRYVHTHGFITNERYRAITGTSENIASIDQKYERHYLL